MSPQKAAPTPKIEMPDAAVMKVSAAGMRSSSRESAVASALARLPRSASPATAWIKSGGEAATNAVATPAKRPKTQ